MCANGAQMCIPRAGSDAISGATSMKTVGCAPVVPKAVPGKGSTGARACDARGARGVRAVINCRVRCLRFFGQNIETTLDFPVPRASARGAGMCHQEEEAGRVSEEEDAGMVSDEEEAGRVSEEEDARHWTLT